MADEQLEQLKKAAFLENLRLTGNVSKSCKAAKLGRTTVYELLAHDEEFKELFDEARKASVIILEDEAHRRAVDGTLKPVYYLGRRCGTIREYSDTLLIFLLKANDPEKYKDRVQSDGDHIVTLNVNIKRREGVDFKKDGEGN